MKNKRSKIKIKDLEYKKLELQPYLKKFDLNFASCIFRFRVKMAPFSENFRGQGPLKICPLCGIHNDTQSMSFQCSKVKEQVDINEKYEDIFKEDISFNMSRILQAILKIRDKEWQQNNVFRTEGPSVHWSILGAADMLCSVFQVDSLSFLSCSMFVRFGSIYIYIQCFFRKR